jgi:hypothetical protein
MKEELAWNTRSLVAQSVGACNPEQLEQTALAGDRHLTQQTLQEIERIMREAGFPLESLLQRECKTRFIQVSYVSALPT